MNILLKGLLSAVIAAIKSHLGAALTSYITEQVARVSTAPGAGEDKKALVLASAETEGGAVSDQLKGAKSWLLNLLIEAAAGRAKL